MNTELIKNDFPIIKDKNLTYLDSASTSLTPNQVVEAVNSYFLEFNANSGRGAYGLAVESTLSIEKTREKIAKFIKSHNDEIIFTKNTTEAINIIANGFNFDSNSKVITSNIEHHSNLIPWLNLKNKNLGIKTDIISADFNGIIDPIAIEKQLKLNEKNKTPSKLVAVSYISNSIGSLQDIKEIIAIAHEYGSYCLVDCAQAIGHVKLDIGELNPDFAAFPGHKGLLGPVGTGFLYIKQELANEITPQNLGGGTIVDVANGDFELEKVPQRFEGGTQNIAGITGLGAGIDYINRLAIENIEKYVSKLTKYLYYELANVSGITLYGDPENLHGIVSFNLNEANPHDLSKILDETMNICLRSGHHCAIPAVNSFGSKNGTVRASLHCYNDKCDVDKLVDGLNELANFY